MYMVELPCHNQHSYNKTCILWNGNEISFISYKESNIKCLYGEIYRYEGMNDWVYHGEIHKTV